AEFLDSSRERGTQTDGVNGHTAQADSFPPNPAANLAGDRRRGPSTSSGQACLTQMTGERLASRPLFLSKHMAIGERIGTMVVLEEERPAVVAETRGFVWRLEYTLLLGVVLLLTSFAIAFFYFSANIESLKSYGYAGLFLINIIGAASILLPSPAGATVVGGGALLEDFLGVPAFVWVGLVAGLGEAIGEFSGYAAGYGGRFIIQEKPAYARIHDWMVKRGV